VSGRTDVLTAAFVVIGLVATVSDLARGKIYNWLTFPAMAAGLAAQAHFGGLAGVGDGLLGIGVAFAAYSWLYFLRAMGAGDVKLLMAFGAWGGAAHVLHVALLGVLLGGAFGLALLAARGKLPDFLRRMRRFLLSVFVRELEPEAPKIDHSQTMPYGLPISAAALAVARGVRLW
jgi:prepilin peptidase CpaA